MVEVVKVKIQPLTAEAFKPYGQMLECDKGPIFPEVEPGEGRVAIEMKHKKPRPEATRMHQMTIHFSYNQTYIPLRGCKVMVVAPPPRNPQADREAYEFDYERLAGFVVKPGHVVIINKGVWHNSFWVGDECIYVNVTRKNPDEGNTVDVEGRIDLIPLRRKYIEFVDIEKRDNRVIEVDLSAVQHLLKN